MNRRVASETSRFTFSQRALAPPVVAIIGFVVLVAILAVNTQRNSNRLGAIETQVFPALTTSFRLDLDLQAIQSALEDSVSFETESGLEAAKLAHSSFLQTLGDAESGGGLPAEDVREIRRLFSEYWEPALEATTSLVRQNAQPTTYQRLTTAQDRFSVLEARLGGIRGRQSESLAAALQDASREQRIGFYVAVVIAILVVTILAFTSLTLLRSVRRLAGEVTEGVARINSSSTEMMALLGQQEEVSNQHAGSIEETTRTVASLVESAQAIAVQAGSVLEFARSTQSTNEEISERNRELAQSLEGITNVLESVRDIANKSELLALNAALEGNKAGEAGRGFSLVAAQMQRLAESVMGNVENIKRLIQEVREASHRAVLAIEEGGRLAVETTEAAERIQLVTRQQETATSQVTDSMQDAALQIQQTVAGVTQSRESMASLADLAAQLDVLLAELRLQEDSTA